MASIGVIGYMFFLSWASVIFGKSIIDPMMHDITIITDKTFIQQVSLYRTNGVVALLFYTKDKATEKLIEGEYNNAAKNVRGMVKVAAIDCDTFESFCKGENVNKYPTLMIYPPLPMPVFALEGAITQQEIATATLPLIPGNFVVELTSEKKDEAERFLKENVAVPKVLLFTDKKKIPTLFKAVSVAFRDRMSFAMVHKDEKEIHEQYKLTKFPTLMVIRGEQKSGSKPEIYNKGLNFTDLYDWLNIFAETFVKGGGYDTVESVEEAKPWANEKIPEMTRASHQDVCFKHSAICVIYISKNEIPKEARNLLEQLRSEYEEKDEVNLPLKIMWSWIDGSVETAFVEMAEATETLPTIIFFRPQKRLRYIKLDPSNPISASSIKKMIEMVFSGDARYKNVGKKLPNFIARNNQQQQPVKKGKSDKTEDL